MARYGFGAGVADFVVAPSDGIWMVSPNTQITFWTAQVDGSQYTDLLDSAGNPVPYVISDEYGQLPRFSGPDEVFGMWADAGGGRRAWLYAHTGGKGEPGDPGAHWYFGTGGPEDAGLTPVAGDLYVETDTGDLYSFDGTDWSLRINLRGPEGPAGTGDVASVNGQTGAVLLAAADVGAVAAAAVGVPSGVAGLDGTGRVPYSQLPPAAEAPVQSVNEQTGAVVLVAADVGAAATSHTHTAAAVGAVSMMDRGAANGVATLDGSSRLPIAQVPAAVAKNVWTPQSLGFQAWTCDPYTVANPVAKFLTPQRLYACGINITEPTQVNRVLMFARGYGGVSTNRYAAGIYREDGTKVTSTASPVALSAAGQTAGSPPQMISSHIGATPISMPSTVTLAPGRYWVTWVLTTGGASDYSFYHVQNEAPVAGANFFSPFGTPFARAWYLASQSNTPTTLSQSAAGVLTDHDIPIMALALA
ncbi:hypothetical protein [Streptomyces odonnellii]|uniref:hypothetical protein n=1 Tax=Streptomyces odonnellii TaxID=1417980 RepID=UPI0006969FBE|nr:hypothetical protein [Streptomyces odonnellii]